MTRLFMVKDNNGEPHLVAGLIDEDLWVYVAKAGRFHRNEAAQQDYFFQRDLEYVEIGIAEARCLMAAGVGIYDEEIDPETLQEWRDDPTPMDAEIVFASMAADLG
ncbi:hypothetical protein [Kribbella sp. DT2]|uniref:hypothetical protein n=1 Tax=Kribbella sp. DT2 TaxID=3393427 RepID=UPI003CF44009